MAFMTDAAFLCRIITSAIVFYNGMTEPPMVLSPEVRSDFFLIQSFLWSTSNEYF